MFRRKREDARSKARQTAYHHGLTIIEGAVGLSEPARHGWLCGLLMEPALIIRYDVPDQKLPAFVQEAIEYFELEPKTHVEVNP